MLSTMMAEYSNCEKSGGLSFSSMISILTDAVDDLLDPDGAESEATTLNKIHEFNF